MPVHIFILQWISEVMHFCAGLPIILVGCKKDLRRDPRVIEELRRLNQRPVSMEEVCMITPVLARHVRLGALNRAVLFDINCALVEVVLGGQFAGYACAWLAWYPYSLANGFLHRLWLSR